MSWVAVAVSVGGNLLGAANSADAAKSAANTQVQGEQAAVGEQQREFDINQKNFAPFLTTGQGSTQLLSSLLGVGSSSMTQPRQKAEWVSDNYPGGVGIGALAGLTPDQGYQDYLNKFSPTLTPAAADPNAVSNSPLLRKFTTDDLNADPVYTSGLKFGLDQGTDALNARNIANGTGFDSGATLKQLVKYANDYGSTKASDSYNRFVNDQNNIYSKLSGQASTGQTAVSNLGTLGQSNTNAITDLTTGGANASAAGTIGAANAFGGAVGSIGSVVNASQNQQLLKQLIAKNNGSASGGTFDPGVDA